jgi:hypothetical protein
MVDFFVSYAQPDRSWATWIAWQLEVLGYTTTIQAWDFTPGSNFVVEMQRAASTAARTIAVLSPDYLQRPFPLSEWAAAFASDPDGLRRLLLPVRVRACTPDGLLGQIVYVDLVGESEDRAIMMLRDALLVSAEGDRRGKPKVAPSFPATAIDAAPTDEHSPLRVERRRPRGFVHAAVHAGDRPTFARVPLPCFSEIDPTDIGSVVAQTIFMFLWLPHSQQLFGPTLRSFTPGVVVCTPNFVTVADDFRTALGSLADIVLERGPAKLLRHEKLAALDAVCAAIDTCFVASVAIPAIMLGGARARPAAAYQTMCDLLLLPVIELHKSYGVARIDVRTVNVGEHVTDVLRPAKRIATAEFPSRKQHSVKILEDDALGRPLAALSRVIAWAVGTFYNNADRRWLAELELLPT